jgi:hypothetical protein
MQMGISEGNQSLEVALNSLVAAGDISLETAVGAAFVPHEIEGNNPAA